MGIFRQVGELLLFSIPTIICLLVVWGAYRVLVYNKLKKILAERHARTEGAVEQAKAAIASAEERTAEYEKKLREARAQIYAAQESARNRMIEQRSDALAEARRQAEKMIKDARATLDQDIAAAKAGLQKQAETLADQIVQSVLRPATAVGGQ
ncbi:MAG TPA: ATP synthase F0 subunit B [Candidatus Angelobacter sp.]|nr:ATP synthase F0 subunit B [Candidatus Angelobacter sp.]